MDASRLIHYVEEIGFATAEVVPPSSLATAAFSVAPSRMASTCLFPSTSTPTAPIQLRFLPAALEIKLGFPSPCDIATIDPGSPA